MSNLRILVLTPHLVQKGGVSNYFNTLSLDKYPGIKYYFVNNELANKLWKKILFLSFNYTKFIFTVLRYDLVHINPSLNFKSYFRDMVFVVISRLFFKKIIVFFRGWDEKFESQIIKSKFQLFLFRATYGSVNGYIVLGDCFKTKIINLGVNSNKIFYKETTVADSAGLSEFSFRKKFESFDKEIKFLFISNIVKEKGIYIAIDAFSKLQSIKTNRKMSLWIAGDGKELDCVKNYVIENKIENVNFTGYIGGKSKSNLLNNCHIMLLPSYSEGLPNSILEGMLYGMPIITRPVGSISDVVKNNINGYLSSDTDSQTFLEIMEYLVDKKSLYENICSNNHKKALKNFTTERVRERLINIYQDILV